MYIYTFKILKGAKAKRNCKVIYFYINFIVISHQCYTFCILFLSLGNVKTPLPNYFYDRKHDRFTRFFNILNYG